MTRRALIPNFTFEHEISGRTPPRAAHLQNERWKNVLRVAPGFRDARPIEEVPDPDAAVAWGYSLEARNLAGRAARHWPSVDVVRTANDKRTSILIERELGIGLPATAVVETETALNEAIAAIEGPWVAKHPFGVSGRDQVRGEPGEAAALKRARRLLDPRFGLVVEPLLVIDEEWSVHFDIEGADDILFRGATLLLTDSHGHFRGNYAPALAIPDTVVESAREACDWLARAGYRGPVGFDACAATLHGEPLLRPVGEINARLSFGRLALWMVDSFGGRPLAWHHPSRRRAQLGVPDGAISLPEHLDPDEQSGTWLEIEPVLEAG